MARQRNSIRRIVAIISAISVWFAALLQALQAFDVTGGRKISVNGEERGIAARSLDPTYLKEYWNYRRDQLGLDVVIIIFTAIGLFGLSYVALILKRVFKRYKSGDSDLPSFMVGCFFMGAVLCGISLLQSLGNTTIADYVSQFPELPPNGLQALDVAYTVSRGGTIYLFSSQFILISIGILICSYLTFQTSEMPLKHAVFGVITAIFGLLSFVFELIVFNTRERGVGIAFGLIVFAYGVILLPSWTVWLGVELRRLKQDLRALKEDDLEVKLNDLETQRSKNNQNNSD